MFRKVQKRMDELHMVSPGDKVLVGISGGADSVALLLVLKELAKTLDFSLEALHVEHGIRGEESKADEAFVKELCQRLDVPVESVSVDVPLFCQESRVGTEEAARILRYQVFANRALEKGAKVALAHHQEDNAETILFQMVRGSSLSGLCGMQAIREDENGVCYIRPLLNVHRAEIEAFLQEQGQAYCTDSTNRELEYSRNFLRAQVIPELEQMNERAVTHMNQAAEHLSEIKEYLDIETEKLWHQVAKVDEDIILDTNVLLEQHPVMQRQIAYKAIVFMAKRQKDITSTHVAELLGLCKGQSGRQISLPYAITAWKEFDKVHLAAGKEETLEDTDKNKEYEVFKECLEACREEGRTISFPIGSKGESITCRVFENKDGYLEIPRKTYTKWFDYDKIEHGLCIRTRRSGDYFISDACGHRKKLKNYFIDEKIPLTERDDMWLLASKSEVLWLIGGRISEHIKVTQKTRYILEITYNGGRDE